MQKHLRYVLYATTIMFVAAHAHAAVQPVSISALNSRVRESLVNIICTSKIGGTEHPISGSGVIIDSRGVILTNAHIGEYFLLRDYHMKDFVTCQIRTGSPAEPAYTAKLIFLPKSWLDRNAFVLREESPVGTGKDDYALLAIDGSAQKGVPLPPSFPAIPVNVAFDSALRNEPVLIAGYPAEFAGDGITERDLYAASSVQTIKAGYYFDDSSKGKLDIFSVGSTILAQGGSSGGPVVDWRTGNLVGILTTTSRGKTTAQKNLYAISSSHINRSMLENKGMGLVNFLASSTPELVSRFEQEQFPAMSTFLFGSIEKTIVAPSR